MKCTIAILIFLALTTARGFSQNIVTYNLEARMDGIAFLYNGDSLNFWGFRDLDDENTIGAVLPGPTIVCEEGDSVVINLSNTSFEAHTIHLHGLDVDQANDGVPSTSFFVQPGQRATYSFNATYAGNFLYHCHVGTVLHLQMGMYGAVIVRAAGGANEAYTGGPAYNRDFMWMTNEVDKSWHDDYTSISNLADYDPDYFHINGKGQQQIWNDSSIAIYDGKIGENIFLRLKNMGYGINRYIFPQGLNPVQLMSDGRPLPQTVQTDTIDLYPGERYGVMVSPQQLSTDSVRVQFIRMYRDQIWGEEKIPFHITGFAGLEEPQINERLVYPNPFSDKIYFTKKISGDLFLYSATGQLKLRKKLQEADLVPLEIDKRGIYIVRIIDSEGKQYSETLIKK
jgi:hypothetical protein